MNDKIKAAGAVVFMLLIAAGFFSNTIYSYNTPEVTGVMPVNGKLQKRETSGGIADWAVVEELYTEAAGKVEELYIAEGDTVTRGQELARLTFDTADLRARLRQLGIEREKHALSIESTNMRIDRLNRETAELEAETYEPDEVSDSELEQFDVRITDAEAKLDDIRRLYEVGGAAARELETAEQELEALRRERENLAESRAKSLDDNLKSVEELEKSRAKAIEEKAYEIETLLQDIKSRELDLRQNESDRSDIESQLSSYETNAVIYAPADGTVVSLELKKGRNVAENQLAASFGVGNTFVIECEISLRNNFTAVGDECKISNTDHTFSPSVTKLTQASDAKEVTIRIESDEITAGETFDIEFTKESANSGVLVPSSSVNRDSNGYFVYRIGEREGILGEEYFAEKLRVEIGDSDGANTAVTKGMMFLEPVILMSDRPFNEGSTITVKNEGDFFVD